MDTRHYSDAGWAILAASLLLVAPSLPTALGYGRFGVSADVGLLLAALFGLSWLRPSPEVPWRGTWRAWIVGAVLALLFIVEGALGAARYATNENLPLYDALLLSRHLYILGRDLYGGWAAAGLFALVIAPGVVWAASSLLAARLEGAFHRLGPSVSSGAVGLIVLASLLAPALPRGRWSTPRIVKNLEASWRLYRRVAEEIGERSAVEVAPPNVTDPADLRIYIIESYGKVLADDPTYATRWAMLIDRLDGRFTTARWHTASAYGVAPVHSGRSWIADASLLFGLHLAHQSEYEHAMALVNRLPHLPGVLADQGYTTVLIKSADRDRPGVRVSNPFGFRTTVFADDLAYRGPPVGWGRIPDQYTIGYVNREILDDVDAPLFAFFHLASSHVPWRVQAPFLPRWTIWNKLPNTAPPDAFARDFDSELAMQVSRFKRQSRAADPERSPSDEQRENYFGSIRHGLRSVAQMHGEPPPRRSVILVMGDHQPPFLAQGQGPEVPIHVMVSDDTLLQSFIDQGFTPGLQPRSSTTVKHEDLFSILVKVLSTARPANDHGDP
ncbi:MAG: hypothetical protein AAGA48_00495 [Myxococcota bacterium]